MLLGRFCSDSTKIGALICHVKVKEQQVQRLSAQDTWGCATLQDTSALRRKHRGSEHNWHKGVITHPWRT